MFLSDKRQSFVVFHILSSLKLTGYYVAGKEDGVRPYSLFFCLGWFQKTEKTPDQPRQLYDDELMQEQGEEDRLDVPIPTTRYDSSHIVRRITNALS
jgi:hypothetical protein